MIQNILRRASPNSPEVAGSVFELRRDITGKLVIVFTVVYLTWHMYHTVLNPVGNLWIVWGASLIVFPACIFVAYSLNRFYSLTIVIWHLALALALVVAALGFQDSRMLYLLCLLPASAVITSGWPAGLVAEVGLAALVWTLSVLGPTRGLISSGDAGLIISVGAALGLLGGAIADTMVTVGEWYVNSYMRAQSSMEEIRLQRVKLAQVIKNLDQAYYRLQRTNADLVAAWKVAAEAERLKTEFATNISHELRTPLNLIAGFSEMMMTSPENYSKEPLPGAYRRDLNTIYRSARHLLDLVDDVIDLARLDAGRLAISREEVDPAQLVQESAAMVRSYIEAKGLNFLVEIEPDLPYLRLDRLRIRQVLLNLLVNATRFTEKGYIRVHAGCVHTVHEQRERLAVRFRVSDTGRGIHHEEMENLFTEFNPGEKPKDSGVPWHSGSGLGLPISKKFVDLHQGQMGVESELGKGTTIWFEIPALEKDPRAKTRPEYIPEELVDMPIYLTDRDVSKQEEQRLAVVVHPDRRLPVFIQRHLRDWRVRGVKTVAQAVEVTQETAVDAVLFDSHDEIPALDLDLPVVAYPMPSSRRLARALGVDGFLSKPVTREELFDAIDRLQISVERVLIVDDDAEMVSLLQRMLGNRVRAQDCLEASNGREALEKLIDGRPDLVLLDLMMPEMDGREFLEQLRAAAGVKTPPVIVISALEEPASELLGAMHVIPPSRFSPAQMLGLVKTVLDALV